MMISVVVPVYNVKDYLPRCIYSIRQQTYTDWECILVDDGSTDGSELLCDAYAKDDHRFSVIHKANGGLSDARNKGTEKATGTFIYFLDSDDWIAPDALRTLHDFAVKNHCEVVQGGFYYAYDSYLLYDDRFLDGDKHPFVLKRYEAMAELIKQQYIKNFAWGKLYRADIVKNIPFPKGKFFEDSFWQHHVIHETTSYGVVPTPLYYYNQRGGSISGQFSIRNLDLLKGNEERLRFVQEHYPDLVQLMSASLWRQSLVFREMARHSSNRDIKEPFEDFWRHINNDYRVLFDNALKNDITYLLEKYISGSARISLFAQRVFDHFFARRIKVIPNNIQTV